MFSKNICVDDSEIALMVPHTYLQFFEGHNLEVFRDQLAIGEIFILKISLAKLWLASFREQDTCERLCSYV